jgi:hypothetical protein
MGCSPAARKDHRQGLVVRVCDCVCLTCAATPKSSRNEPDTRSSHRLGGAITTSTLEATFPALREETSACDPHRTVTLAPENRLDPTTTRGACARAGARSPECIPSMDRRHCMEAFGGQAGGKPLGFDRTFATHLDISCSAVALPVPAHEELAPRRSSSGQSAR